MNVVVGAAIVRGGRLLAAQRGHPPSVAGLWELPGGRVEDGEDDQTALARECFEELGVTVVVGSRVGPDVILRPGLVMRIYGARLDPGEAEPYAHDHQALRWLGVGELESVDWLPGDRILLPALRGLLGSGP